MPDDSLNAPRSCHVDQTVKHAGLESSLKDPATHNPKIYLQIVAANGPNDYRDNAIVSEFVFQTAIKGDVVVIARNLLHFRPSVPFGCQIKLICLANELSDSIQIRRCKRPDLRNHFEGAQ